MPNGQEAPHSAVVQEATQVSVNGVIYDLPPQWDVKTALEVVHVVLPTAKLDKVFVPLTRIEVYIGKRRSFTAKFADFVLKRIGTRRGRFAVGRRISKITLLQLRTFSPVVMRTTLLLLAVLLQRIL